MLQKYICSSNASTFYLQFCHFYVITIKIHVTEYLYQALQNRLRWFGHVQRMEENRILERVLYMNFGTTR
jgi:hypothetical protein